MQVITQSLVYRLFHQLYLYYQNSSVKRWIAFLSEACRHSLPARWLQASKERESALQYAVVFRVIKGVLKVLDKWMVKLSQALESWSETSLITGVFRAVIQMSGEKMIVLAFPVFGIGYLAGRILRNNLMIRDVLLLGLMFIVAGILMIGKDKRNAIWKNSLSYRLYLLLLE